MASLLSWRRGGVVQQEEGVGREQRRRADDAVREAKVLSEEVERVKEQARTVSDFVSSLFVTARQPDRSDPQVKTDISYEQRVSPGGAHYRQSEQKYLDLGNGALRGENT